MVGIVPRSAVEDGDGADIADVATDASETAVAGTRESKSLKTRVYSAVFTVAPESQEQVVRIKSPARAFGDRRLVLSAKIHECKKRKKKAKKDKKAGKGDKTKGQKGKNGNGDVTETDTQTEADETKNEKKSSEENQNYRVSRAPKRPKSALKICSLLSPVVPDALSVATTQSMHLLRRRKLMGRCHSENVFWFLSF